MPSAPRIASKTMAQSSTVRQIGPILSLDQFNVITPVRLTRPNVGRNPVTRQTVLGPTIDPSVSVPMAKGTSPAEVAAAEPADEPPVVPEAPWLGSQGLRVCPPNQTSPFARDPVEGLATRTAFLFNGSVTT